MFHTHTKKKILHLLYSVSLHALTADLFVLRKIKNKMFEDNKLGASTLFHF